MRLHCPRDQAGDECTEPRLAAAPGVVHEREEAGIGRNAMCASISLSTSTPGGDLGEFEPFFAESDVTSAALGGTAEFFGRLRSIEPDPRAVGRLTGEVS